MTREQLYNKAKEKLDKSKAVLLQFGTGVGKTKTALDLADGNILIVYHNTPHLDNWKNECNKWNINKDITYTTYDSLHHLKDTKWDFIILDECHSITELRLEKLQDIYSDKYIYLSATVPYEKKLLLNKLAKFTTVKFTLTDAINAEILPPGNIYIVNRFLDNTTPNLIYKKHYKKYKEEKTVQFKDRFLYKNTNLNIICTEKEYYTILDENVSYWKNLYTMYRQDYQKIQWLLAGNNRKTWLNNLKTDALIKLLEKLNDKRVIIFAYTKEQLDQLNITDYIYSKNSKKVNEDVLNKFNSGDVNKLFNLKILNEGMNLSNIDAGIIVGIDSKPLSSIQRMGRVWRSNSPEVYFIRIPFTRDDDYFTQLREEVNQDFIIHED